MDGQRPDAMITDGGRTDVTNDWKRLRPPFAFRWFLPGLDLSVSFALVFGWAVSFFLLGWRASETRLIIPAMLNLPGALLGLFRRDLVPYGIPSELWRSFISPIVGTAFWWLIGRGWEALAASRKHILSPRLTWIEVSIGVVLAVVFGAVGVGMLVTSDREGMIYPWQWMAAGSLLWCGLELSAV